MRRAAERDEALDRRKGPIARVEAGGSAATAAQQEWAEFTTALVAPTVLMHQSCSSWYDGGNVPGEKRMYMGFTAEIHAGVARPRIGRHHSVVLSETSSNDAGRTVEVVALPGLTTVRDGLGERLFGMVAGPEGPANRARIHDTPGPRWFGEDRPIRRVHGDASMFVGGLRALLLQSLHPLAMAGVAGHSDYKGDPWGRLQRTSTFLAVTTFGPTDDAQRAVDKVRGIHRRVHGTAADGRPYEASDPHLLEWVHIAEIDSFLLAHQLYGAKPLDQQGRDDYVADTARVATALGVIDPPRTEGELKQRIADYRPEMSGTPAAREAAKFLLLTPPLPMLAKPPYAVLAATSVAMLPAWARQPLRLPYLPPLETTAVRVAGRTLVGGIRWALDRS